MENGFGVTFIGLDEIAMVFNGSQPIGKEPSFRFRSVRFFSFSSQLLKKGWSLPGKSFNFGRLASTSGLSSSSASTPAWYLSYYLFGFFCLVPLICLAILVSAPGLQNEIYFSVVTSVLQAQFKSAIKIDVFLLFRFFDNCPD